MGRDNDVFNLLKLNGKQEEYLAKLFSILKKRESILFVDKKTNFNNTDIRMISEIVAAKYEGKRLISTQIAKRLGVTRSAISQIVNRLESQGVVKRVPDEVDKKIAYIELAEGILEKYGDDIRMCLDFVGKLVEEFGEENFNKMYELFVSFVDLGQQLAKNEKKK